MALIVCPKCGKNVSDTTEKCFHCGFNLVTRSEAPVVLQRYNRLPVSEQNKLRSEYYKLNPEYESFDRQHKKFIKITNIIYIIGAICGLIAFCFYFGSKIYRLVNNTNITWTLISILIFVVLEIGTILTSFIMRKVPYKRYRYNNLIIEKKFQKWLKDKKNIEYVVTFKEKQKKDKEFFDQIDITKDEIER